MLNFFRAGPDLVKWDLVALSRTGPYRLTLQHAGGVIVEYFDTTAAALSRESQLEQALNDGGESERDAVAASVAAGAGL